ncbi:hypothetical protein Taro_029690 [Colocasia esculenta]|uniref:Aminotransferase-like plant mobile domain-containing protein n=1 Tax=Colocasia esculenta TaxID=4460 RepID=A0A843VRW7_COLES|nr:hypothetical protein [Colocasia esculenta]
MKRSFSAFQDDIKPYVGPKAARVSYAELQRLSFVPEHICARPELQILPGHRRFSKVPWNNPQETTELFSFGRPKEEKLKSHHHLQREATAPTVNVVNRRPLHRQRESGGVREYPRDPATGRKRTVYTHHLREWGLTTVLTLVKQYHKIVHVWDSITALAELWHPQTHTFIFPGFEATILLEELELMLGLSKYKRGEEHALSYTMAPINVWSILEEITTKKTDLYSMTSRSHVHLLPISQWVVSQCKRKTGNHLAIAKATAIYIYGVILFPTEDDAISLPNLSIIDSVSEGMSIAQAVLGYLYAGLSSAATGGSFYGSIIALELWMGMHIQFRTMDNLSTECKSMLHHPLTFVGAPLYMTPQAWCKTAQVKGMKEWRDYFKTMTVTEFDMSPRFLHNKMIYLPQRTGLALRLIGNKALVLYNLDRCHLQCGDARTVVPLLSHYPPIQELKRNDDQDERDVRSTIVHWEGCTTSLLQAEVVEDEDVTREYLEALKRVRSAAPGA